MEKEKIDAKSVVKEKCPKCGGNLTFVGGDRIVLVICTNHKMKDTYKLTGDGKCDFSYVVGKEGFF